MGSARSHELHAKAGGSNMWVIVAVVLAVGGTPKVTLIPGPEFATQADCVRATGIKGGFDRRGGGIGFSFCVPKDSFEIASSAAAEPTTGNR
jgi:hypothetical protein